MDNTKRNKYTIHDYTQFSHKNYTISTKNDSYIKNHSNNKKYKCSKIVKEDFKSRISDENDIGDLNIILWNKAKTKQILNYNVNSDNMLFKIKDTKPRSMNLNKQFNANGIKTIPLSSEISEIVIKIGRNSNNQQTVNIDFKKQSKNIVTEKSTVFNPNFNLKDHVNSSSRNVNFRNIKAKQNQSILKKRNNYFCNTELYHHKTNYNHEHLNKIKSSKQINANNNEYSFYPPKNLTNTITNFNPLLCSNMFKKLETVLYKLFMDLPFYQQDLSLNNFEKEILKSILIKKKFEYQDEIMFSTIFFNTTRKTILKKKTEDELKFIFKRAIKYLKNNYLKSNNNFKGLKLSVHQKDDLFYEYYYGEVSKLYNIPIESFHHFRNWKNRTNSLIPKSITKKYVSNLKLNPEFVSKIVDYLNNHAFNMIQVENLKKIKKMVSSWEQIYLQRGFADGLKFIKDKISSRSSKFPWTKSEISSALESSLKMLA